MDDKLNILKKNIPYFTRRYDENGEIHKKIKDNLKNASNKSNVSYYIYVRMGNDTKIYTGKPNDIYKCEDGVAKIDYTTIDTQGIQIKNFLEKQKKLRFPKGTRVLSINNHKDLCQPDSNEKTNIFFENSTFKLEPYLVLHIVNTYTNKVIKKFFSLKSLDDTNIVQDFKKKITLLINAFTSSLEDDIYLVPGKKVTFQKQNFHCYDFKKKTFEKLTMKYQDSSYSKGNEVYDLASGGFIKKKTKNKKHSSKKTKKKKQSSKKSKKKKKPIKRKIKRNTKKSKKVKKLNK